MNAPLAKEQIALLMTDSLTYRMPPVEGMEGAVAEPRQPWTGRLMFRIVEAIGWLADLPRRRAVVDELRLLSDRELADIGLARADLGRVFDPRFAAARGR